MGIQRSLSIQETVKKEETGLERENQIVQLQHEKAVRRSLESGLDDMEVNMTASSSGPASVKEPANPAGSQDPQKASKQSPRIRP